MKPAIQERRKTPPVSPDSEDIASSLVSSKLIVSPLKELYLADSGCFQEEGQGPELFCEAIFPFLLQDLEKRVTQPLFPGNGTMPSDPRRVTLLDSAPSTTSCYCSS